MVENMDEYDINTFLNTGNESQAREALRQLLSKNSDINQRIYVNPPLISLAQNRRVFGLFQEVLVRPDVDINLPDYHGISVLEKAFRCRDRLVNEPPRAAMALLKDTRLGLSKNAFRAFAKYSRPYRDYVPEILQLFLRKGWRPTEQDYVDANWLGPNGIQLVDEAIAKIEAKEKGRQLLNLKLGLGKKQNTNKQLTLKYTPKITEYLTGIEGPLNVASARAMKIVGVAGAEEAEARALANWIGNES